MKFPTIRSSVLSLLLCLSPLTHAQTSEYEKALSAFHQHDVATAYVHIKNSLQERPDFLPALLLHCELLIEVSQYELAEGELKKVLEKSVDQDLYAKLMASALLGQFKYDEIFSYGKQLNLTSQGVRYVKLAQAEVYRIKGKYQKAQEIYQALLRDKPEDEQALVGLAGSFLSLGGLEGAKAQLAQLVKGSPNSVNVLLLSGRIAQAEGQPNRAIEFFQQALEREPENITVLKAIAIAYVNVEQLQKAGEAIEQVLELNPYDPHAQLMKSSVLAQQESSDAASQALNQLYNQLSGADDGFLIKHPQFLFIDAITSYRLKKWGEAERKLSRYLALEQSVEAAFLLADVYQQLGQYRDAVKLLDSYKAKLKGNRPQQLVLARLYLSNSKYLDAIDLLDELRSSYPGDAEVLVLSAKAKLQRGHMDDALTLLEQVEDKGVPEYLYLKAKILFNQKEYRASLRLSQQLVQASARSIDYQLLLLRNLYALGDYQQAALLAEQLFQKNPKNSEVALAHASLLSLQGRAPEAEKILRPLVEGGSENNKSWLLLADLYFKTGRTKEAVALLHENRNKDQFETRLQLARVYFLLQEYSASLAVLKELENQLELEPAFLFLKAEVLIALKENDESERVLSRLDSLLRKSPDQLVRVSQLWLKLPKTEKARNSLEQALKIEPQQVSAWLALAQLDIAEKEFRSAESKIRKLKVLELEESQLLVLRGDLLLAKGQTEQAFSYYQSALKSRNMNSSAFSKLTQLAYQGIQQQGYIEQIESMLERRPEFSFYQHKFANFLLRIKAFDKAKSHYQQALQLPIPKEERALILNNMAWIELEAKQYQPALVLSKQALKIEPEHPLVLDTYGWTMVLSGQIDEGIELLRESIARDAGSVESRLHLAYALAKTGRMAQAAQMIKEVNPREIKERENDLLKEVKELLKNGNRD